MMRSVDERLPGTFVLRASCGQADARHSDVGRSAFTHCATVLARREASGGDTVKLDQVVQSIPAQPGRKVLSFDEVVASRRTAVFQEFGDLLLYLGGTVFILRDADSRAHPDVTPPVLDPSLLAYAVGIETGWRHAEDCDCDFCFAGTREHVA